MTNVVALLVVAITFIPIMLNQRFSAVGWIFTRLSPVRATVLDSIAAGLIHRLVGHARDEICPK